MTVFLLDTNTGEFHTYVFDYAISSPLKPRKWLLNNILYSFSCPETRETCPNTFSLMANVLVCEYNKC